MLEVGAATGPGSPGCWRREGVHGIPSAAGSAVVWLAIKYRVLLRGGCVGPPLPSPRHRAGCVPAAGRQWPCQGLSPSSLSLSHPGVPLQPHALPVPHAGRGPAAAQTHVCPGRRTPAPPALFIAAEAAPAHSLCRGCGGPAALPSSPARGAREGRGWPLSCPGRICPQEGGSRAASQQGQHGEERAGCWQRRGGGQRCSSGSSQALHWPEGRIQPYSSSGAAGQGWDGGPAAMLVGSAGSQSRAEAPRDGVGGPGSPSAPGPEAKVGLAGSAWGCPGLTP